MELMNQLFEPSSISVSPDRFGTFLSVACSEPKVAEWVRKGHDDSLWWPLSIRDQRTRMLVAGLSTRISYRMVGTYREVVDSLGEMSWAEIAGMSPSEFRGRVKKLGLVDARERYWRSLVEFVAGSASGDVVYPDLSNDVLVHRIASEVQGSSYKVAQCCVLYARGYYSGVIPVDSGMKDLLLPCMGFPSKSNAFGHEQLRQQLESLTRIVDVRSIAERHGYGDLDLPRDTALTWWTHLVLIYFKRFFCNERSWESCPLRAAGAGCACRRSGAELGGVRTVIVEGADGCGKTELSKELAKWGYRTRHIGYDPQNGASELVDLYGQFFDESDARRQTLDRSFLSEVAYGTTLRDGGRLSPQQITALLERAHDAASVVIYLSAPLQTCLERRTGSDAAMLREHHEVLLDAYERVLSSASQFVPVLRFDTSQTRTAEIMSRLGLSLGGENESS